MEAGLIMLKGRRDTPGRPAIWGTTPQFLAQFGLNELRDLPRREDLLLELPIPTAAAVASPDAAEAAEHEAAAESQEEPPGEDATDAPEDAASNPDRS
jgi:segregation and condensation protein B